MGSVGIIAEFNPFHNGHGYIIEKAREITGAEHVVVIISGDFVERGEPAVMDKYLRTKAALACGADIVLELPAVYATGSSEYFAFGAVKLLNKFGVDYICFGSEEGDIRPLSLAAEVLENEKTYAEEMKKELKAGLSYPAARILAIRRSLPEGPLRDAVIRALSSPNNILGTDYLRALKRLGSDIKPFTIKRNGEDYNSERINEYASAAAIRRQLGSDVSVRFGWISDADTSFLKKCIPDAASKEISDSFGILWPVFPDDMSSVLNYRLSLETAASLTTYSDVSEDLANTLKNVSDEPLTYSELLSRTISKNLTGTRVRRALLHVLLSITEKDMELFHALDFAPYVRILGLKKEASFLIKEASERNPGFIITKLAAAKRSVTRDPAVSKMFSTDLLSHELYTQLVFSKYGTSQLNEARLVAPVIK